MDGPHYGMVVSSQAFNRIGGGLVWVCPISQGAAEAARTHGTVVSLMNSGMETQGAVHCHQLKALDIEARKGRYRESTPDYLLDEVLMRIEPILFPNN